MVRKSKTTFDRWLDDPEINSHFNKNYKDFVLSELILAMMDRDSKSVRQLAREIGVSPTVIQNLRAGKQEDMKVKNFVNVAHACGYHVFLVNEHERIPVGE